jgi:phospholipid/cholesterol/gamma-HCH transport system permease protein
MAQAAMPGRIENEGGLSDATSLLTAELRDGRLRLAGSGAWTARHAAALETEIAAALAIPGSTSPRVTLDMSGVTEIDTYGALLLDRIARAGSATAAEIAGLSPRFTGLTEAVRRAAAKREPDAPPPTLQDKARAAADGAARWLDELWRDMQGQLAILGAIALAAIAAIKNPRRFRLTSTVHQIDRVAWQAVPIIVLITFLIGGIIAQQGFFHFRRFGADQYVVDMVGILVLREIGVLIVAIMVAGRSGSSYTAELGSMKMREEIDALKTMGLDPTDILMLPRVTALVLSLPVLAFIGSISALIGGGVVAATYGDMAPEIFVGRLREAISMTHFKVGLIKAPFMALAIGIVACAEGLKVGGSAESLGLRTTASVVKSIFLVIVLDGLFAMYFAAIGM